MTTQETLTFGILTVGTIINFNRCTTGDDTNFAILRQYEDRWGLFTEGLNLDTFEIDAWPQHSKIENFWSIVKIRQ